MKKTTWILMLFFYSLSLWGQSATVTIQEPIDSSANQSVKPDIVVSSYYDIVYDPADLHALSEFINVVNVNDLQFCTEPGRYQELGVSCTYTMDDDNTVIVSTPKLNFGEEFSVVVDGLPVLRPAPYNDTAYVDLTQSQFGVTEEEHKVVDYSMLHKRYYNHGDTIWIKFNRPVDSVASYRGNIVDICEVISMPGDSLTPPYDSLVYYPATCWLAEGGTEIRVIPQNVLNHKKYHEIMCNLSILTGDERDNMQLSLRMMTVSKLTFNSANAETSEIFPTRVCIPAAYDTCSLFLGDTLELEALQYINTSEFEYWTCPQNSIIDGSTSRTLSLVQTPYDIKNLDISAVYKERPKHTVTVNNTTYTKVKVYSSSGVYLGRTGEYDVLNNDYITVATRGLSSSTFLHWESDSPEIDMCEDDVISVCPYNGPVTVTPHDSIDYTAPTYHIKVQAKYAWAENVFVGDEQHPDDIEEIVSLTSSIYSQYTIPLTDIIADIIVNPSYCDCFRIQSIYVDDEIVYDTQYPTAKTISECIDGGLLVEANDMIGMRHREVTIIIGRQLYNLEVSIEDINNSKINNSDLDILPSYSYQDSWLPYINTDLPEICETSITYTMAFYCGTDITIESKLDDHFSFHLWKDDDELANYWDGGAGGLNDDPVLLIENLDRDYLPGINRGPLMALIEKGFSLEWIEIRISEDNGIKIDPEKDWAMVEQEEYQIIKFVGFEGHYEDNVTGVLVFHFNKAIHESIMLENILIQEKNLRFMSRWEPDLEPQHNGLFFPSQGFAPNYVPNYELSSGDKELQLTLYVKIHCHGICNDISLPVRYGQLFEINILSDIQSSSGEHIINPHTSDHKPLLIRTEFPEISLRLLRCYTDVFQLSGDINVSILPGITTYDSRTNDINLQDLSSIPIIDESEFTNLVIDYEIFRYKIPNSFFVFDMGIIVSNIIDDPWQIDYSNILNYLANNYTINNPELSSISDIFKIPYFLPVVPNPFPYYSYLYCMGTADLKCLATYDNQWGLQPVSATAISDHDMKTYYFMFPYKTNDLPTLPIVYEMYTEEELGDLAEENDLQCLTRYGFYDLKVGNSINKFSVYQKIIMKHKEQ